MILLVVTREARGSSGWQPRWTDRKCSFRFMIITFSWRSKIWIWHFWFQYKCHIKWNKYNQIILWWHQAITWTNIDLSSMSSARFCVIHVHPRRISFMRNTPVINHKYEFKNYTFIPLQPHFPGANELINMRNVKKKPGAPVILMGRQCMRTIMRWQVCYN